MCVYVPQSSGSPDSERPYVGGSVAGPAGGHHGRASPDSPSAPQREGNTVWVGYDCLSLSTRIQPFILYISLDIIFWVRRIYMV